MLHRRTIRSRCCIATLLMTVAISGAALTGCREKKEKIIDIETPNTDIEVERSRKSGNLDIKVRRKTEKD